MTKFKSKRKELKERVGSLALRLGLWISCSCRCSRYVEETTKETTKAKWFCAETSFTSEADLEPQVDKALAC